MRNFNKRVTFLCPLLALCLICLAVQGKSSSKKITEYDLKTAYIYNFVKFTDWPKTAFAEEKQPLVICVFNDNQFDSLSRKLKGKKKNEHLLKVVRLSNADIHDGRKAKQCHVLFIPFDIKARARSRLEQHIKGLPVLTIGEQKGFLEKGGTVNFVLEKPKIRFEINLMAAEQKQLKIRAQLLRLAKRVIRKDKGNSGENDDK